MERLLREQDGVVARRQLLAVGHRPHDIARWVRRRDLVRVLPGVYVGHTGPPTWSQRAWAAVLYSDPAALSHWSALRAAEGPGGRWDEAVVHVAVDERRRVLPRPGLVVHRVVGLEQRVQWHLGPPRMRYEHATVDVATQARNDFEAIAVLGAACQSRRTTAARLRAVVEQRSRVPRREWVARVLDDVAAGTCSVLEHGYLTRVERPHGLVGARRQVRSRMGAGSVYRDVEYACGLVVELDGRLFHDSATQRDRDFDRDLDAAVLGKDTRRISWGQVFDRPCRTAERIAVLLRQHGWQGTPHPCPECGASDARGATDPPLRPAASG